MFSGGAVQHHVDRALVGGISPRWVAATATTGNAAASGIDFGDCGTPDALGDRLALFARRLGFDGARYVHLGHRLRGQRAQISPPLRFLSTLGNRNDPWRDGDPAARLIAASFLPFEWDARDDLSLPDVQRHWLSLERSRGVEAGIAVPVQDYLSGPAYLSLFGAAVAIESLSAAEHAAVLTHLATRLHLSAKKVLPLANPARTLSEREVSCLRHAATGASVSETAASLEIASRTVEFHTSNAARKLEAANKIHAVAVAIGLGLIQI